MRHGSLFSGIGGFDLAAEWMGWENVFHCEWNEFGQKVLKYYWPEAESFSDITKTDFTKYYGTIDIITGGFPCQPYSSAGKRRGKEDERHLWPEMLRAIREVSPRFVVGENVRGLTNWNGDAANAKSVRLQESTQNRKLERRRFEFSSERNNWNQFPTQSAVCSGNDGLPTELDGITFSKWRAESIKAYGNAIVPQVAYEIFKAIIKTAP